MSEWILYWAVRVFGFCVRMLPVELALALGQAVGILAYYFDTKHRRIVFSNLRIAFSGSKSPSEIRRIARATFMCFGQNGIELLRFPLMNKKKFEKYIHLEGAQHIAESEKQGKGVILLAVHYGSWEIANLIGASLGYPYKVLVKAQTRNFRLGEFLDELRRAGGATMVHRGAGTRDILKGLKNNEIVSLVADQGGKDGLLVPFFGKEASMSSGAIRLGLKYGIPICPVSIVRLQGPCHRLTVFKPLDLVRTGDEQSDVRTNLIKVTEFMEHIISQRPEEYMWFYKIWKYTKESVVGIITDGKAGHMRQAEAVAGAIKEILAERGISAQLPVLPAKFKSLAHYRLFALLAWTANVLGHRARLFLMKFCLTADSYGQLLSLKPDILVSCGSGSAGINFLLAREYDAKNIAILKPGIWSFRHFDLVILPRHDAMRRKTWPRNVVVSEGALNLITEPYILEQKNALLKRFSHLKSGDNFKIGVLLGGDTQDFILSEQRVRILINQLKEIAEEVQADVFLTTSRRTSVKVENLLMREMSRYRRCKFLVLANRENVVEAVGGILGLSDLIIVSGDSISMVSEAASAGKKVTVFPVECRSGNPFEKTKHGQFLERLRLEGYVLSADIKFLKHSAYQLIKNKVQTRPLNDAAVIRERLRLAI